MDKAALQDLEATLQGFLESISQSAAPFPDKPVHLHRPVQALSRWFPYHASGTTVIGMDLVAQVVLDFELESSIRKTLGGSVKNFENVRRGKHSSSPTTLTMIQHELGLLKLIVPSTVLADPQGPLAPEAQFGLKALESLLGDITHISKMTHPQSCPCCGHEYYTTAHEWATRACLGLDEPAARLVDRLLNLLVSLSKIFTFCQADATQLREPLRFKHPLRYWMERLRSSYEADSWEHLAVLLQQKEAVRVLRPDGISASRLRKWASSETPPRSIVYAIIQDRDDKFCLGLAYHVARLHALIQELISAASEIEIDRPSLRKVIAARYDHLIASENSITPVPADGFRE